MTAHSIGLLLIGMACVLAFLCTDSLRRGSRLSGILAIALLFAILIVGACVPMTGHAAEAHGVRALAMRVPLPLWLAIFVLWGICTMLAIEERSKRLTFWAGVLLLLLFATATNAADVKIPAASLKYRHALEQAAGEQWGLSAPVARVAAQLHQESGWNPKARSPYAEGLAQFTPPTAQWLPDVCPNVGKPDPWDADWSIRAVVCYDAWLESRAPGAGECARWAFALSAYNGGERARDRERVLADKAGADPDVWFGAAERYRSRTPYAWHENRVYVWRILRVLEPVYVDAGWPGEVACT